MKKRLFDFSPGMAFIAVIAYALLITLFSFVFANTGTPLPIVVIVLLGISFLFLFWYFVLLAPVLTTKEIRQGVKRISAKNARCEIRYSLRFKETQLVIHDKQVKELYLDEKKQKKRTITVQATAANLKKTGEWLGISLEVPKDLKKQTKLRGRRT